MPPNFIAVKKGDEWSSVDDPYEDERKQWLLDNPEPSVPESTMRMRQSWQTRLPNHDPSMDDPIWGPSVAMRVVGDYSAGSPVRQDLTNVQYEGGEKHFRKIPKTIPAHDDPTWDPDVESEWERDSDSGAHYYFDSHGQKNFVDLKEGMKGSWWARPTRKDATNLYAHESEPKKLVFVREKALQGTQMKRDSDQNLEGVAEMFLQHDENLPKEGLATIPLRGRSYQHAAAGLGLPDHTKGLHSQSHHGVGYSWSNPSRWSDAPLPWRDSKEEEKESKSDKEDWWRMNRGKPMDIAFQLLKFEESYGIPPKRPGESISDYMTRMASIHMDSTPTPFRPLTERDFTPYVQRPQESNFDGAWQQMNAGEPMDIAFQLLKYEEYPFGDDMERRRFFSQARAWGISEEQIKRLWEEKQAFQDPDYGIPSDPPQGGTPQTAEEHPGDVGEKEATREGSRTSFPTTLIHRDSTPGAHLKIIPNKPPSDPPQGTFRGTPFNEGTGFTTGEPMNIAFQLLKEALTPEEEEHWNSLWTNEDYPAIDEIFDKRKEEIIQQTPSMTPDDVFTPDGQWKRSDHPYDVGKQMYDVVASAHQSPAKSGYVSHRGNKDWPDTLESVLPFDFQAEQVRRERAEEKRIEEEGRARVAAAAQRGRAAPRYERKRRRFSPYRGSRKSEPMDIALRLLKDRKSPEAWANKRRYDTQYEKNPKRVKYREQLNAERRRRGIYGGGGSDVSHTQGGKLTLEGAHSNRARHFKGKGTLRRVKVR